MSEGQTFPKASFGATLLALFAVLATLIAAASFYGYQRQRVDTENRATLELDAIAGMKAGQIAAWRQERIADAEVLRSNTLMFPTLGKALLGRATPGESAAIVAWMNSLREQFGFPKVALLDAAGVVHVATPRDWQGDHLAQRVAEALRTNRVLLTDLHRDLEDPNIHMALVAPLQNAAGQSQPGGALVIMIDPYNFLYPLIQSWPILSPTAETVLVRREGDDVLFLNELRHRKGTALNLRLPIRGGPGPAVAAAMGREGHCRGNDYRGVPVLGAVRRVPDSPWFIVAKVDVEEIRAPLRTHDALLALAVGSMVLAAAAFLGFLWRNQRARFYRERYQAELDRRLLASRYELLSRYANDAVLLLDEAGRITEANERASEIYGYGQEEWPRLTGRDLRAPASMAAFDGDWAALQRNRSALYETLHRRKNGAQFSVEVSSRIIDIENRRVIFSIVRDISERKRTDQELHRREREYRMLVENTTDIVMRFDRSCRFLYVSPSIGRATTLMPQEVLGKTPQDLALAGLPAGFVEQAVFSVFASAAPRVLDCEFEGPGGRLVLDWRLFPEFGEDGDVRSVLGVARDMTAQRRSEENYRSLFETMLDGFALHRILCDAEGRPVDYRFLNVNPAFERMTGLSAEQVLGKTVLEVFPSLDAFWIETYGKVALSGESAHFERYFEGLRRHFEIFAHCPAKGLFATLVADITERKLAEEALRQSEARLARAQQMAALGNWEADPRTGDIECSPDVYRILGWPSGSPPPTRERLFECVPPPDLPIVTRAVEALVLTGAPQDLDHRIVRPDGASRWVRQRAELIRDGDGAPARLVGVIQDITEYRHLQDQLRQAQKLESIGRLAGGVAHDFNNLLTVINAYSEFLLHKLPPEDAGRKDVDEIRAAAERAAGLTQQLLAFSRQQALEPRVIQPGAVVAEMGKMLRRLIGEDIELVTSLQSDASVSADPGQLQQVLMNLAVNARDAMPEGGRLTITVADLELDAPAALQFPECVPGSYVTLTVSDTGSGMDAETQSHIFEPFFTTKEAGKGTGLGLATVYGIVTQSGGHITVASAPGQGATFTVLLPQVAEAAAGQGVAEELRNTLEGTETILLVEDADEVRRVASEILLSYGYRVLEAANGGEALRISQEHPEHIPLLLTDIVMPKMSGVELAELLRPSRPETRVLFMSGYADHAALQSGGLPPGSFYMQKPFAPAQLAQKVREALDGVKPPPAILVVDDDPEIREFLRTILEEEGYKVLEASDGAAALQHLAAQNVNLVIADLLLPGEEAADLIQRVRRQYPAMKTIAISGAFGPNFLRLVETMGAAATLEKPFTPAAVLAKVRACLA